MKINDGSMKDNDTPVRTPGYVLEQVGGDYQLRHQSTDTAIYLNQSAAIIWELCDGTRAAGEIKHLLKTSYPDAAGDIESGINDALSMLLEHGALAMR